MQIHYIEKNKALLFNGLPDGRAFSLPRGYTHTPLFQRRSATNKMKTVQTIERVKD